MGTREKREGKLNHKGPAIFLDAEEEHKLPAALLSIAFPAVADAAAASASVG